MNSFKKYGLAVLMTGIVIATCSWGFLVHKTIHQLAVYELPVSMRKFFYKHMDYLVENATRPDTRRNTDATEAPKHFIDIEMYGDSAEYKLPLHWDDAVKMFTKDTLL